MISYVRVLCLCLGLGFLSACGQLLDTSHTHSYETVYVVDADGANTYQISPDLSCNYGAADWSPDGTQLVYASSDLGDLFVSPVTGDSVVNLTQTDDRSEHSPKWSSNGTYISYYVGSGSSQALYVRLADGTNPTLILDNVTGYAWSPDETYLAVVSAEKLYLLTVVGVNQGVLTQFIDTSVSVTWLSTTVMRYSYEGTDYLMTTSGTSVALLDTTDPNWTLPEPQLAEKVSADGYYRVSTGGDIQKILAHGTYAVLSDDNNTVISVYQQSVYRHDSDGSNSELLYSTSSGSLGNPILRAATMLFVSGGGIYVGTISSGAVTQIATGLSVALSSNGTKVAYVGFRRVSE